MAFAADVYRYLPGVQDLGRERIRSLPLVVRIVLFPVAILGWASLGAIVGRGLARTLTRRLRARCPTCGAVSVPETTERWESRYRCSSCDARTYCRYDLRERIAVGVCFVFGLFFVLVPLLPRTRVATDEPSWLLPLSSMIGGLVVMEFALVAIGVLPRLLRKMAGPRLADPFSAGLGLVILQMVSVLWLAVFFDAARKFPLGRRPAVGAALTFTCVGLWLVARGFESSSRWSSPRAQRILVKALLSAFAVTALGVVVASSGRFLPGALFLVVVAGLAWWRLGRGGVTGPGPPPA